MSNPLALGLDPGIGRTGYAIVQRLANRYIPRFRRDLHLAKSLAWRTVGDTLHDNSSNAHGTQPRTGVYRERLFQQEYLQLYLNGERHSRRRTRRRASECPDAIGQASNCEICCHRDRYPFQVCRQAYGQQTAERQPHQRPRKRCLCVCDRWTLTTVDPEALTYNLVWRSLVACADLTACMRLANIVIKIIAVASLATDCVKCVRNSVIHLIRQVGH